MKWTPAATTLLLLIFVNADVELLSEGSGEDFQTDDDALTVAKKAALIPSSNVRRHEQRNLTKNDDCLPKLDLIFLLDSSGSIEQIYEEHVRWATSLVSALQIEKDAVQVAAVQYAGFPLTEFALGTYPTADDIRQHLSQINFQSGVTRTGYALRKAETELFEVSHGARKDATKVIILFTDGLSIDDPLKPANQLRNIKGVKIYVVSVGNDGFESEMSRIAGHKENVFGPNELPRLRNAVLNDAERARACTAIGPSWIQRRDRKLKDSSNTLGRAVIPPLDFLHLEDLTDESNSSAESDNPGRTSNPGKKNGLNAQNDADKIDDTLKITNENEKTRKGQRAFAVAIAHPLEDKSSIEETFKKENAVPLTQSSKLEFPVVDLNENENEFESSSEEIESEEEEETTPVPQTTTTLPKTTRQRPRFTASRTARTTTTTLATTESTTVPTTSASTTPRPRTTTTRTVRVTSTTVIPSTNGFSARRITPDRRTKAHCPLDVLFVLDSSGSVQKVYEQQKSFLRAILEKTTLAERSQRVAVLQFAGSRVQKTEWSFDAFAEPQSLMNAFENIRLITGTTYIGAALDSAFNLLEKRRPNVSTIVVLLSDGYSQDDASVPAEKIRHLDNVDFYSVSVSTLNNIDYLIKLVGRPDRVFADDNADKFSQLLTDKMSC